VYNIAVKMKKALYPGRIKETHTKKRRIQDCKKTANSSWRDYTPVSPE